jgi:hypothetical protein
VTTETLMISADSHVVEDPSLWGDLLPKDHWGALTSSFSHRGADNFMWSNDYPHEMSTWPKSRELARARLAGLEPAEIEALLARTARSLYVRQPEVVESLNARALPVRGSVS